MQDAMLDAIAYLHMLAKVSCGSSVLQQALLLEQQAPHANAATSTAKT